MADSEIQSSLESSMPEADQIVNSPSHGELVLGTITAISESGHAVVCYNIEGLQEQASAIATIKLLSQHIGRQVGLLFTKSPEQIPVIVGLIHNPLSGILDSIEVAKQSIESEDDKAVFEHSNPISSKKESAQSAVVDGERVVIEGKEEIVLKCGEASITLSKNGKISIRGKYLLNRSTGVNRIMGGSVQVN